MTEDEHLNELMRQCSNVTPLIRLSNVEQLVVFRWLLDNGHMTRTGKALDRPRAPPVARSNRPDGTPVYDAGADFSPTEKVTMR